jgi:hAT family C-terminal dimerisation region
MSSSVSSERAFSQGGITITKLRSCLKGDIVEALQCLKCGIRNDALFQERAPSSTLEVEDAGASDGELVSKVDHGGAPGEENQEMDIDMDELFIEDKDEEATSGIYDSN